MPAYNVFPQSHVIPAKAGIERPRAAPDLIRGRGRNKTANKPYCPRQHRKRATLSNYGHHVARRAKGAYVPKRFLSVTIARAILRELADNGMTMLGVTHEMGFSRGVANRMAMSDEGQQVEVGTIEHRTQLSSDQILYGGASVVETPATFGGARALGLRK